jgi:hypothetical protein
MATSAYARDSAQAGTGGDRSTSGCSFCDGDRADDPGRAQTPDEGGVSYDGGGEKVLVF